MERLEPEQRQSSIIIVVGLEEVNERNIFDLKT